MYGETVVEGDGYNRLHGSFLKKLSDFDVCDLHKLCFLSCVAIGTLLLVTAYSI